MQLQDIDIKKTKLLEEVEALIALKKEKYSDIDITLPMSHDEKELNNKIASVHSEIFQLIRLKRSINFKK